MQDSYKKPLIIGASVLGLAVIGLFVKNYLQESKFKPIQKIKFLKIYKQLRKQNYSVLKQIAMVSSQIASQFKQITPQMIKGYLQGPQSPIKVQQMFQKSVQKVSQKNNITSQQFQFNLKHYKDDFEFKQLADQSERQFETALTGRMPPFPVTIPESLTKQRILQIQAKIVKQKYLFQINMFKKLRKYTKQQLAQNPDLLKQINPPQSEQKMLQQQNIGDDQQPASAVLHAAILKYKSDQSFKQNLISIENSFKNIYTRYEQKINSNKITEIQLGELQDQIIYFQHI